MSYRLLKIEKRDNIAWLRLDRPPSNSLTIELMEELIAAHRELESDRSVEGILLASALPKFFCNGIDPGPALEQDIEGRLAIFQKLSELIYAIYSYPNLEVAVIGGHAMAGGAVLACLADFRFMSEDCGRIGFTEVAVGLTLPKGILELIRSVVGEGNLTKVAMLGETFRGPQAHQLGLADALYPSASLERQAENRLLRWCALPKAALRDIKQNIRAEIAAKMKANIFSSADSSMRSFLQGSGAEGLRALLEGRKPQFQKRSAD